MTTGAGAPGRGKPVTTRAALGDHDAAALPTARAAASPASAANTTATTTTPVATSATFACKPGCGSRFPRLPSGPIDAVASGEHERRDRPRHHERDGGEGDRDQSNWLGVTPIAERARAFGQRREDEMAPQREHDADDRGERGHAAEHQQAGHEHACGVRDHRPLQARDLHLEARELLGVLDRRRLLLEPVERPAEGRHVGGAMLQLHEPGRERRAGGVDATRERRASRTSRARWRRRPARRARRRPPSCGSPDRRARRNRCRTARPRRR